MEELPPEDEKDTSKSFTFVDSYFEGSQKNAMAALLQSAKLTEEQLRELKEILEQCREVEAPGKKERDRGGCLDTEYFLCQIQ